MNFHEICEASGIDPPAGSRRVEVIQTPKPHQLDGFNHAVMRQFAGNFSDVGTGKTLTSYLYLTYFMLLGKGCVTIMKPSLIGQFMDEFERIVKFPQGEVDLVNFSVGKPKREKMKTGWGLRPETLPNMLVLSYDMYKIEADYISDMERYVVMVADEAHALKNPDSKMHKSVQKYVGGQGHRLLAMTATPSPLGPQDAYGVIKLTNPEAYQSFGQFDRTHCRYRMLRSKVIRTKLGRYKSVTPKVLVGCVDLDALNRNLYKNAVRYRQEEVLSLAKPNIIDQIVHLTEPHYSLYRELIRQRMLEYGDKQLTAMNDSKLRMMALQLITQPEHYSDKKVGDAPLEMLQEIIDQLGMLAETKLLVFCHFRKTVEKLDRALAAYNPALVYGKSDTDENVVKFKKDPSCRVMIASKSANEGLNLQEQCNSIVFYEAIGSPSEMSQMLGRVHRSGQEKVVNAWLFRYRKTISESLIDKMLGRSAELKTLLSDKTSVWDELLPK